MMLHERAVHHVERCGPSDCGKHWQFRCSTWYVGAMHKSGAAEVKVYSFLISIRVQFEYKQLNIINLLE